jgi:hypothetical protein
MPLNEGKEKSAAMSGSLITVDTGRVVRCAIKLTWCLTWFWFCLVQSGSISKSVLKSFNLVQSGSIRFNQLTWCLIWF